MQKTPAPTPTIRDFPEETICPSCGKFVGAYTRCPYCGAEHKHRISIRFFRIFSITVAIGGLFLIWLAARGIKAPLLKIEDIKPLHSFAYVRVEGENMRTFTADDGMVSFTIDDGTGELRIRAYPGTGKALIKMGRVPVAGDRVSVEGTLQFRGGDYVQMLVNVPEKVKIEPAEVKPFEAAITEIAKITPEKQGAEVVIEGKVTDLADIGRGTKFKLTDPSGSIDVVVWDSIRSRVTAPGVSLAEGKLLKIRGHVGEYQGTLQVAPRASGRIEETTLTE
jgi:DNA/RNA endonuclease YhcR with UshA esterase domain